MPTLADEIIQIQFWFEYGLGKCGLYLAIINLGLLLVANLTLKGLYFPIWALIPVGLLMVAFMVFLGYFLDTRNVMGRLTSHLNRRGNPEFADLLEQVERIEKKIDDLQGKL